MSTLGNLPGIGWALLTATGGILAGIGSAQATPPILYSQPTHQSPVRGGPDELLLLPGSGFADDDRVVLEPLADGWPERFVSIVSRSPYALTVRLPEDLDASSTYSLRVRNSAGEASNAVRINDARPLWISPGEVFANGDLAGLERRLKLVGRNLQPAGARPWTVRFSGPSEFRLDAMPEREPSIARYVVTLRLPREMTPGSYRIALSRDGLTWTPVEQPLLVRPDPPQAVRIPLLGCLPDDGLDDTPCVVKAIATAAEAGGGTVVFGPGTWHLDRNDAPGVDRTEGIYVPPRVDLEGAGASATRILRAASWQYVHGIPSFTLSGENAVRGFTFSDARSYRREDPANPFLRLGKTYYRAQGNVAAVQRVVITANVFDRTHIAIADGGLPIQRLFITHNRFGPFREALSLGGNRFNMTQKFRIDDSVIAHNVFMPGSYLDESIRQGAIATEIGASLRLDFSDNVADGTSESYLYSPGDAHGWRAAHFWHMNGSHELMLVAGNTATCTGDKVGDGEAFSYDANANTFAFDKVRTARRSTATTVTVAGSLVARQNDRDVDVATYYVGHWVQIAAGPGLGQARKIVSYRTDADTGDVTFEVSPAWDVPPAPGTSRVSVGREYWQVYTIGNVIDHRRPACRKSNRWRPKGGGIVLWGQSADSVVEGNRQYDTDGISFQQYYNAKEPGCAECYSSTTFQSFVEIRNNVIAGEYDWGSACSLSGITGSYAVAPTPGSPPPTLSFGLSITGNTIEGADGYTGGAIVFPLTWWNGPPPHRWRLIEGPLIQHNVIRNISGFPPRDACNFRQGQRIGIHFQGRDAVSGGVLYGNLCENVDTALVDRGAQTVRVCSARSGRSCECEVR